DSLPLEIVKPFNYLGIELSMNGKFNTAQKAIAVKGSKSLLQLYNVFDGVYVDISQKCKLFDSYVGSVLSYGA
ncbi:hypothetical protein LOTGIDRAFT_70491, partial [Lottia gigantea]